MRRSRQVVAASAFAVALFVPAIPLAAQETGTTPGPAAEPTTTAPAPDAPPADTAPAVTADQPPAPSPAAPTPAEEPQAQAEPEPEPAKKKRATVRAAASKSVTIRDFSFGPSTITIAPGDTVTWTNQGPSIHTATANDGAFDSGDLAKGKSFSKTFSSAGTFSYICRPHPFMTGRIVVASGSGGGGSGGGGGGSSGGGATGSGSSGGTAGGANGTGSSGTGTGSSGGLPNTGADVAPWALFGFSLLVFGAALRWRLNAD